MADEKIVTPVTVEVNDTNGINIRVCKSGTETLRELMIDGLKSRSMNRPQIIAIIQQFASTLRDY